MVGAGASTDDDEVLSIPGTTRGIMTKATRVSGAIVAVCLLAATACSSDGDATTSESASTAAPATEPPETTPSTDAPTTEPPATTEPEAAEATTTTTSDASPPPPEAGEPNTVNIVFEDGETGTAPVSCDSDPDEDVFELSFQSGPDDVPYFDLSFIMGTVERSINVVGAPGKVSSWETEDEIWFVSPNMESIDVDGDLSQSPISGTGVYLKADLTEDGEWQFSFTAHDDGGGQPLTTGEERSAAFTIVCADFSGG
jgi:hypothetical protein